MKISDRIRICMTVHGFRPTAYIRRIWIVFAGWCRVRFPATAVFLALFGQFLFSRLYLLSSSFASLYYWCMCFAVIISFIGGNGSWTPFCTEKGLSLVFLAWSRPSSLTVHFLGIIYWVMRTQLFKSCKINPPWINYEWIHLPSYTVYTEIRRIYGHI